MGLFDAFGYKGKRALVVGGATGMGAAAVDVLLDAGAEVVVMDRAEVVHRRRQVHPARPVRQGVDRGGRRRVRRARSTPCSPAPASPTARPASRRSTSSATAT